MDSKFEWVPRLVIIEGNEKGKILTLTAGTQILGRVKADITLNDPRISRSHVSITFDPASGAIRFSDLKSLNGTEVNGAALPEGALKDGDQIQIGDTRLDLQILKVAPEITAQERLAEMLKKPDESVSSEPASIDIAPPGPSRGDDDKTVMGVALGARAKPNRVRRILLVAALALVLGLTFQMSRREGREDLGERLVAVDALISAEKLDEALASAIRLSALHSDRFEPHLRVAEVYRRQGKWELAIGAYQKAHLLPGAPPVLHARLLRLYSQVNATDAALTELSHVDRLVGEGPYDRDAFVEIAGALLELRDELRQPLEKSFILAKALQKEIAPEDPIGFKLEAHILIRQGKFDSALAPLKRALELSPTDEWLRENTTFAHLKLGDLESATQSALEWIRVESNAPRPLLVMAYLKVNQNLHLEGLPYAQRIVEMLKEKPDTLYAEAMALIGNIYLVLGQANEAKIALAHSCGLGFSQACEEEKKLAEAPREATSDSSGTTTPAKPTTSSSAPPPATPSPASVAPSSMPNSAPIEAKGAPLEPARSPFP